VAIGKLYARQRILVMSEDLKQRICNALDIDTDFEALLRAECRRRCDLIYAKYDKLPDTRENREKMLGEQSKMIEAFVTVS
jgi:hypothetical protein